MSAQVHVLVPKRDLLTQDAADRVFHLLSGAAGDELPQEMRQELRRWLHRRTQAPKQEGLWPGGMTMLSREQTAAIWDALRTYPSGPVSRSLLRHTFDLILLNLRQDTGEVMLTRDQFAKKMGTAPDQVSAAMTILTNLEIIRRERRRVAGMRGPGVAVYFINPHVAWNGALDVRKATAKAHKAPARRDGPLLKLMEGGQP